MSEQFNELLSLNAGFKDASDRLKESEQKLELAEEKERQQLEEQEKAKALQDELKGLYNKGKRAVNSKDWETAIAAFQEVVKLDSQYQDAAKLLGFAESELKKIEERKKQEIRLVELYARAVKANKANNWTLVISTCQEIRTIDPSYKDVATLLDVAKTNLLQQETMASINRWIAFPYSPILFQ